MIPGFCPVGIDPKLRNGILPIRIPPMCGFRRDVVLGMWCFLASLLNMLRSILMNLVIVALCCRLKSNGLGRLDTREDVRTDEVRFVHDEYRQGPIHGVAC